KRRELVTLKGHTGSVNAVIFTPDGTTLASASDDRTIKLWDVQEAIASQTAVTVHCPFTPPTGFSDTHGPFFFSSCGSSISFSVIAQGAPSSGTSRCAVQRMPFTMAWRNAFSSKLL